MPTVTGVSFADASSVTSRACQMSGLATVLLASSTVLNAATIASLWGRICLIENAALRRPSARSPEILPSFAAGSNEVAMLPVMTFCDITSMPPLLDLR